MNKKMRNFCKKKLAQPDYYTKIEWYSLLQPITILLGPNGTGKTSSIRYMIDELKNTHHTNIVSYSTSKDDTRRKHTTPLDFRPEALAANFLSEGERMNQSFFTWVEEEMLPAILKDPSSELFIFIDEADSGLSLDKIYEAFNDILFIMREEVKRGRRIHLIVAANSYELAEVFNNEEMGFVAYMWVPTNEYIILGSYNKFKGRYMEYYREMNFDDYGKRRT